MRVDQLLRLVLLGSHIVAAAPRAVPQEDIDLPDLEPAPTSTAYPGIPELEPAPTQADGDYNTATSSQPDEGYPTGTPPKGDLPPYGPWRNVKCDQGHLNDTTQDPKLQWLDADAENAWYDCFDKFRADSRGQTFTNFLANFFNARPDINCQDLENPNCQVTINCGQNDAPNAPVNSPAGYMIVNSIINVHNFYESFYAGLKNALLLMNGEIGSFASVFAPQYDPMKNDKIALDMLSMFFSLVSAPAFNSWLKRMPMYKNNPNSAGTIKDTTNSMVNQGITLAKDSMVAVNVIKVQNDISSFLTKSVDASIQVLADLNKHIFTQPPILYNMIYHGKLFDRVGTPTALDITQQVRKSMWAYMIPYAWKHSNTGDGLMFIMNGDGLTNHDSNCNFNGEPGALWERMGQEKETIDKTKVCIDGKPYWLMALNEPKNGQCQSMGFGNCPTPRPTLRVPPGLTDLDGKKWGGLTKEDLVRSALASYRANGEKNGWAAMDAGTPSGVSDISDNGMMAKGVVNIPICSYNEAADNAGWTGPKGQNREAANYPCN